MLTFFSDCAGLFTLTFDAAMSQEYFFFLLCFLLIEVTVALFCFFSRGLRRL